MVTDFTNQVNSQKMGSKMEDELHFQRKVKKVKKEKKQSTEIGKIMCSRLTTHRGGDWLHKEGG